MLNNLIYDANSNLMEVVQKNKGFAKYVEINDILKENFYAKNNYHLKKRKKDFL